jgi:hypothetical protein
MDSLRKHLFLIFLLLLICITHVNAQFYSVGQDPASVKWLQINTVNFQVIFPQGYEDQAQYITDVLEWSYEHVTSSLEHRPRKVSVIVHNQTVISNGFVSWAPRRMELYATPPANNEHHDWMESLIIHEFRHVVQIDKLNQGLTRLLGILFGEMGTGAVAAHLPVWFLEGDAVVTETEFTRAGRGRLPEFEQGLRAQVLSRGKYSFDKAFLGSYKDYVPNYYELGYQLVASARATHGPHIWSPVINNAARRPWGLFPFSFEMKRQMGTFQAQHYRNTFTMLDSAWTVQREKHSYTPSTTISPSHKLYTHYQYPQWINDTTILALKSGLRNIPGFYLIDINGNEKFLFAPGTVAPNSVHATAGKLVWTTLLPDPRWEHRNYAEIMVYDFQSRTKSQITKHGKYFSPALSPGGNLIATTEVSPEGVNALVILDAFTGTETWRYSYPGNDFIMQPAWHKYIEKIAVIVLDENGKRLDEISIPQKTVKTLMVAENADISSPSYFHDDILINGTWSGINNIYRVNRDGEIQLIVSSEFGAINPRTRSENIVYSDYTANGYTINVIHINDLTGIHLKQVENHSVGFYRKYVVDDGNALKTSEVPRTMHSIKPYRRIASLFHLHSWFPAFLDIDNQEVNPGVSIFFQNKLSTSFAQLGYLWDVNDQTGRFSGHYTYKGWYPVAEIIAESGERRFYYRVGEDPYNFLFKENNLKFSLSVPLRYQQDEFFYGFTPFYRLSINQTTSSSHTPDSIFVGVNTWYQFGTTNFFNQEYRIFAFRQKRSVARDIFPRSGQIIDLNYRHTPWGKYDMGTVLSARGIIYLPSLIRHHGIKLIAGYQHRTRGENLREDGTINLFYNFGNLIPYPRGMMTQSHQWLRTLSVDYALPLLYPDLSIPPIMYIKRLKGYVFYDQAYAQRFPGENNRLGIKEGFTSYGFGITSDMHFMWFFAPFTLGVQFAFPEGYSKDIRLIYSISF